MQGAGAQRPPGPSASTITDDAADGGRSPFLHRADRRGSGSAPGQGGEDGLSVVADGGDEAALNGECCDERAWGLRLERLAAGHIQDAARHIKDCYVAVHFGRPAPLAEGTDGAPGRSGLLDYVYRER